MLDTITDPRSAAEWRAHYRVIRKRLNTVPVPVKPERPYEWVSAQDAIPNDRHSAPAYGALNGADKVAAILKAASRYFRQPIVEILSRRHHANLVRPRHVAMYLCHHLTTLSYPIIGRLMDKRDHSTIMNGVQRITARMKSDRKLAADIEAVMALAVAADPALVGLAPAEWRI